MGEHAMREERFQTDRLRRQIFRLANNGYRNVVLISTCYALGMLVLSVFKAYRDDTMQEKDASWIGTFESQFPIFKHSPGPIGSARRDVHCTKDFHRWSAPKFESWMRRCAQRIILRSKRITSASHRSGHSDTCSKSA
jgi:hypothetical protein